MVPESLGMSSMESPVEASNELLDEIVRVEEESKSETSEAKVIEVENMDNQENEKDEDDNSSEEQNQ